VARRPRKRRRATRLERSTRYATPGRYEVSISPRGLTRLLLIVAITLLVCHAALALYHYRVEKLNFLVIQLFDVDQENNLPSWYSGCLLLIASALLWFCARTKRSGGDPWSGTWYALAVGFLLLSVDEVAGIHESINSVIVITWAIPGGAAALVIGLAFIPFLLHLPRRTALLFALAGALYLGGAAGLEVVGNSLVAQGLRDTLRYNLWSLLEESLELFGVILFVDTLLRYMRGSGASGVHASLKVA
jgi:hypothetical protein